ncbi:MAG: hypothetical protein R3F17_04905 [Planctomycetota bacterium]
MSDMYGTANVCPTRIDGQATLFAHQVSRAQCQSRQRDSFHKCFTCVHNNAYARANASKPARAEQEVPAAQARG